MKAEIVKEVKQIHTPLPWKIDEPNGVYSADFLIGVLNSFTKSDREFIIRAVNSNEALLEAAKELLKMAETQFDDEDGDGDPLAKYRKAIAKAEGK